MRPANRVANLPPYVFATLGKRLAELRAQGRDIIRLDMGSPDMPPPEPIIEALYSSARDAEHHGYPGFSGIPALRQAIADYYARRFDVTLDPASELVPLIGSKEGIVHMAIAWLDPGDVALVTDPGYPPYDKGARLAGAEPYPVPLLLENNFLPDLDAIPADVANRARLLWLNYPNNPTGVVASLEFFARAVDWARRHEVLLCHDNPYCDVTFDGYRAPSLLQVPGAKEVAVEFNSLSKTYNMGGWRVGFAVGNAEAVKALGTVKTNVDSGIFRPVQDAAVAALTGDQSWLAERNAIYQERRDIVLEGFAQVGIEAHKPLATLYVWPQVPAGYTSSEFCDKLLLEAGVSVTPGNAFGARGEGFFRVSLGQKTDRIKEAMVRLREVEF